MNSRTLKSFFKKVFNLEVGVRTIACKNPFVQVWLPWDGQSTFPNGVRRAAVLTNYNKTDLSELNILNPANIQYGTTNDKNLSIDVSDIETFLTKVKAVMDSSRITQQDLKDLRINDREPKIVRVA